MRAAAARGALLVACNAAGLAAFCWPFLLPALPGGSAHARDAPFVLALLVALLGGLLFTELGRGGLGPKTVALIGVLGAAMVALRLPGYVAGFSPMFLIVLLAGNAFGPGFGFTLGAVGTFASGLFVGGLGPWLPFQMVAVGWVGAGAGLVGRGQPWARRLAALALYAFVSGYLFGALMNLWAWPFLVLSGGIGYDPGAGLAANLRAYGAYYAATSFAWDSARAIGGALVVLLAGRPLLGALDRAARRMQVSLTPARPRRERAALLARGPAPGEPGAGPGMGAGL